jgi:hypothetical protein
MPGTNEGLGVAALVQSGPSRARLRYEAVIEESDFNCLLWPRNGRPWSSGIVSNSGHTLPLMALFKSGRLHQWTVPETVDNLQPRTSCLNVSKFSAKRKAVVAESSATVATWLDCANKLSLNRSPKECHPCDNRRSAKRARDSAKARPPARAVPHLSCVSPRFCVSGTLPRASLLCS